METALPPVKPAPSLHPIDRRTIPCHEAKSSYSPKQKRMAEHIEKGYEKRGVGRREAGRRAWATVNKQTGGAKRKRTKSR